MNTMTLEELTKTLNKLLEQRPDLAEAEVVTEGCDCKDSVLSIETDREWLPNTVFLGRSHNHKGASS